MSVRTHFPGSLSNLRVGAGYLSEHYIPTALSPAIVLVSLNVTQLLSASLNSNPLQLSSRSHIYWQVATLFRIPSETLFVMG